MATATAVVAQAHPQETFSTVDQVPEACGIVIFGASGDLSHRKLFPALFQLVNDKLLPPTCYVLGVGRTPLSNDQFRAGIHDALKNQNGSKPAALRSFVERCSYLSGDYGDPAFYAKIKKELTALDQSRKIAGNRLYYLSTPPSLYEPIMNNLKQENMARPENKNSWIRVVVEKPYGHDLESAQRLTMALHQVFEEDQIYRIDHYLGKESVQNILMFRFANAIYEPIWNSKYIDHIQITAAEAEGVGHRAGYYEQAGVLRDMFQNHLLQLLSLVAMEPPVSMQSEDQRNEKAQVIESLKPWTPEDLTQFVVRGQYEGYRREKGVNARSSVETFAALKVEIDNWRWQGVPFYLRSGKRMAKRVTEINVQFKHVPASIFKPLMAEQLNPNVLNFRLQPNEGISLRFEAKRPGTKLSMSTVTMEFNYEAAYGMPAPEAYGRLFLDVMLGDQTLFARKDWLNYAWCYLTPILEHWAAQKEKGLTFYEPGSWGPAEADSLMTREGRAWLTR